MFSLQLIVVVVVVVFSLICNIIWNCIHAHWQIKCIKSFEGYFERKLKKILFISWNVIILKCSICVYWCFAVN